LQHGGRPAALLGQLDRFGLAAGGGVEYAINPQWSVKEEYIWKG
jgi:opacity protein-like surface antigen